MRVTKSGTSFPREKNCLPDKFKLYSDFKPCGDQPQAIEKLSKAILNNQKYQTLLGVTGSGKTFTMANVIQNVQKPTLIISHNKTLAWQLYQEFKEFFPNNEVGEGKNLLIAALNWKQKIYGEEEAFQRKKYKEYNEIDLKGVDEKLFPSPIKKLLNGLEDGRKRGLFVLLTFLRSLGFSAEYINDKIKEWNEKNSPPLRKGYIRNQIDWHLKQKRKILPPNYSNDSFYRDLGLLDEKPKVKNPLVEVQRKVWKK